MKVLGVFAALVVAVALGLYAYDASSTTSGTITTTSSSGVPPTTSSTTTSTDTVAACTGGDFSGMLGSSQGAAGTIFVGATVTNTSGAACTVDGWPTLTMLAGSTSLKVQISDSTSEFSGISGVPTTPQPLTLAPTATAQFEFAFSDVPAGSQSSCPTATSVLLTIAPSTASTSLALANASEIAPCGVPPTVWVSPLYS